MERGTGFAGRFVRGAATCLEAGALPLSYPRSLPQLSGHPAGLNEAGRMLD